MLTVSDAWRQLYPGASAGILHLTGVANPAQHEELDRCKLLLEDALRAEFGGVERTRLRSIHPFDAYQAYFGGFGKTYHVQLQIESVALKNRGIPRVAALVEAMFMAELKNRLLTAGHDADTLRGEIRLDVAEGNESYALMNGRPETLKPGDMFMADDEGVISSVLYGPDNRTRLQASTTRAVFAVYAPPGITPDAVRHHLLDIAANARLISPSAAIDELDVCMA